MGLILTAKNSGCGCRVPHPSRLCEGWDSHPYDPKIQPTADSLGEGPASDSADPTLRKPREGWGTRLPSPHAQPNSAGVGGASCREQQKQPMLSSWSRVARRIRVPTGFLFVRFLSMVGPAERCVDCMEPAAGCARASSRAYASGYVKKNAELTMTGPTHSPAIPLYLGSSADGVWFCGGLPQRYGSRWCWLFLFPPDLRAYHLRGGTVPGSAFPAFEGYAKRVPRLLPRLTPARISEGW